MTRSFTSMLLALQSLAAIRGGRRDFLDALRGLPDQVSERLNGIHATIKALVGAHTFADYVFLGQGPFFGIAQESMLKVKEMSCSYAQSFHTLEFRHGPKAIVSPETLITFIISESGFDAEVAVLEEIKKLGGATLVVANSSDSAILRSADYAIELSLDVPEVARAAASVIPGQLLGFYIGNEEGAESRRATKFDASGNARRKQIIEAARMPLDVCVVGEINPDLILYGVPETLQPEKEALIDRCRITLGASSAIFAHNLAVLGTRVGMVSKIGADPLGKIAFDSLARLGC